MIKPNELRIGNLVYKLNMNGFVYVPEFIPLKIKQINFSEALVFLDKIKEHKVEKHFTYNYRDLSPISLTEDWLKSFGFEMGASTQPDEYALQCQYFDLCYSPSNESWSLDNMDSVNIDADIQYVHQLQNLYFALTGKELEPLK